MLATMMVHRSSLGGKTLSTQGLLLGAPRGIIPLQHVKLDDVERLDARLLRHRFFINNANAWCDMNNAKQTVNECNNYIHSTHHTQDNITILTVKQNN